MHEKSALILARWGAGRPSDGPRFLRDSDVLPESPEHAVVVLERGSEARADELMARGAATVLLADAALQDSAVVGRLVQRHGAGRIGIWLPVEKRHVSWTLDCVSNEDFRCLTPSVGKAGWEVLMSDGTPTGTDAEWWVQEMLAQGACMVLIGVDMQDDGDLNICAGLMECHGDKLWFTPRQHPDADMEPWVRYGKVRQLVLPEPNDRDEAEMARLRAAAMTADASIGDEAACTEIENVAP